MIRPTRATSQRATDPRPALVPAGRFDAQPPFYLDRPVTLIGSRHRAHVRLESDDVSRSHAVVVHTHGRVVIRDLGSRSHVYVNGREAWEAQLADGDYVSIGPFSFRFAAGDASRSAPPAGGAPAAVLTGTTLVPGGVPLDRTVCVIGCRHGADLLLRGSAVSFAHAVIVRHETGHLVRDLGSRTGTYLNGSPVEGDAELLPGCVLRVGPYEMKYAAAAAGATSAVPPPEKVTTPPRYWDATTYAGVMGESADDSGTLTPAASEARSDAGAQGDAIAVEPDTAAPDVAIEVVPEPMPPEVGAAEAPPAATELPEVDGAAELEAWAASVDAVPAVAEPVAPVQPPAPVPLPVAEVGKPRRARKKPARKVKARQQPSRAEEAAPAEWPEDEVAPAPVIAVPRPEPVTVVLPPAPPEADPFTVFTAFAPADFSFLDAPAAEPVRLPTGEPDAERQGPPIVPAGVADPRIEVPPEPEPQVPAPAPAPLAAEPLIETPAMDTPVIAPSVAEGVAAATAPVPDVFEQLDALLPEPFGPETETATAHAGDVAPNVAPEAVAPPAEAGVMADAPGGGEFDLVAPVEEITATAPVAVVPPPPSQPTRPIPSVPVPARGHHRHEPAPPPPAWGVLAAAIAISESPLDEATAAPAATGSDEAAPVPPRRSSLLKWFGLVVVLLAGSAAAAVAVFGHATLLKFFH